MLPGGVGRVVPVSGPPRLAAHAACPVPIWPATALRAGAPPAAWTCERRWRRCTGGRAGRRRQRRSGSLHAPASPSAAAGTKTQTGSFASGAPFNPRQTSVGRVRLAKHSTTLVLLSLAVLTLPPPLLVRHRRRWPPVMCAYLEDFLALRSTNGSSTINAPASFRE